MAPPAPRASAPLEKPSPPPDENPPDELPELLMTKPPTLAVPLVFRSVAAF
jgi:hypothetical protein